jgi:hypothetical protein
MRHDQPSWRRQGFQYPRKYLSTRYSDRLLGLQNPARQKIKKHRCVLRVAHDALREILQSLNGFEVIENEIKAGEE